MRGIAERLRWLSRTRGRPHVGCARDEAPLSAETHGSRAWAAESSAATMSSSRNTLSELCSVFARKSRFPKLPSSSRVLSRSFITPTYRLTERLETSHEKNSRNLSFLNRCEDSTCTSLKPLRTSNLELSPRNGFCSLLWLSAYPPNPQFRHQQTRFSQHPYKPPSRDIFHPHIPGPESLPSPKYENGNSMQTFIPTNHYPRRAVEALRFGEYLGEDVPWNLLPWKCWKRRKYNVATKEIPWMISKEKGVSYHKRLNVFTTQWTEDGVYRIRRFRAAFGLLRAKRNAEQFRRDLEASGRVDNRRTTRQRRLVHVQKRDELRIRKKRFAKIASGQF